MAELAKVYAVDDKTRIKQKLEEFAEAFRSKDLEKLLSFYSPDIVAFDIMPPLKYEGIDSYRKSWEKGFSMMEEPIDFEIKDVDVAVSGDVAFCHCLNHMTFTSEGKKHDMWLRWTGCFRKIKDDWQVTHEHVSVPIDMDTDKAIYDLKPAA